MSERRRRGGGEEEERTRALNIFQSFMKLIWQNCSRLAPFEAPKIATKVTNIYDKCSCVGNLMKPEPSLFFAWGGGFPLPVDLTLAPPQKRGLANGRSLVGGGGGGVMMRRRRRPPKKSTDEFQASLLLLRLLLLLFSPYIN